MGFSGPFLLVICFSLYILSGESLPKKPNCPFDFIYNLGDGTSDNGNAIRTFPSGPQLPATRFPYGITYPGRPTGRWSDGRLLSDHAARALGFTHIKPFLDMGHSYDHDGVVFAVEGSPILEGSFYARKGVRIPSYVAPLEDQILWFGAYLASICSIDCGLKLANSLIVMGDIEANDIRYPLLQGKSIEDIQTNYVPPVIETLITGARGIIRNGGHRVAIAGNAPLGCYPSILSAFESISDPSAYDDLGCLKSVNNLVMFRNNMLQRAINALALEFPNATIIYTDFYTAIQSIMRQATVLGFDNSTLLKACCGTGGKYNYDENRFCGSHGVPVCSNIKNYIHWDGIHLTDEANYKLSEIVAANLLPSLGCV